MTLPLSLSLYLLLALCPPSHRVLKQWHLRECESEKARERGETGDRYLTMSMTQQPACFIMGTATDGRAHTHRHTRIHTEQLSLCLPLFYPFRRPQCPNLHDRDSCVCEIETENGRVFVTGACAWNDNSLFRFLFSLQLQLPFFWHFQSHYPHICNVLNDFVLFTWAHDWS